MINKANKSSLKGFIPNLEALYSCMHTHHYFIRVTLSYVETNVPGENNLANIQKTIFLFQKV